MANRARSLVASIRRSLSRLVQPASRERELAERRGSTQLVQNEPGRFGETATVEVPPPDAGVMRVAYSPSTDGDPDSGEVIWTWVPYDEQDGRGKDRPVLVIGRQDEDRIYAVRLTSKSHEGDRDFLAIGSGPWDTRGRPSWIDIEQVYSVHWRGMRREASALDRERFTRVADALHRRYGWAVTDSGSGDGGNARDPASS